MKRSIIQLSGKLLLKDKIALITGTTSGIGRGTAIEFVQEGAKVAITGRNLKALHELENSIRASGGDVYACPGDVSKEDDVKNIVSKTLNHFGRLDVLVNGAGILKLAGMQDTTPQIFDECFNVNTRGVFLFSHYCIPHLEKTKGNIVNVSSVNGMQSFGGVMAYCASKAAVDHMTRCAAVDLAPKGIRVNCVSPGIVITELQLRAGLSKAQYEAFLERCKQTHPIGRAAEPWEVAALIAYLASEKSGFITGAIIPIDGGRACLGAR